MERPTASHSVPDEAFVQVLLLAPNIGNEAESALFECAIVAHQRADMRKAEKIMNLHSKLTAAIPACCSAMTQVDRDKRAFLRSLIAFKRRNTQVAVEELSARVADDSSPASVEMCLLFFWALACASNYDRIFKCLRQSKIDNVRASATQVLLEHGKDVSLEVIASISDSRKQLTVLELAIFWEAQSKRDRFDLIIEAAKLFKETTTKPKAGTNKVLIVSIARLLWNAATKHWHDKKSHSEALQLIKILQEAVLNQRNLFQTQQIDELFLAEAVVLDEVGRGSEAAKSLAKLSPQSPLLLDSLRVKIWISSGAPPDSPNMRTLLAYIGSQDSHHQTQTACLQVRNWISTLKDVERRRQIDKQVTQAFLEGGQLASSDHDDAFICYMAVLFHSEPTRVTECTPEFLSRLLGVLASQLQQSRSGTDADVSSPSSGATTFQNAQQLVVFMYLSAIQQACPLNTTATFEVVSQNFSQLIQLSLNAESADSYNFVSRSLYFNVLALHAVAQLAACGQQPGPQAIDLQELLLRCKRSLQNPAELTVDTRSYAQLKQMYCNSCVLLFEKEVDILMRTFCFKELLVRSCADISKVVVTVSLVHDAHAFAMM